MTRFAMIVDLGRCVGCQTCTAACKHANATAPGVQWRRVLDVEVGEYPDVRRAFVPVGCMHCEEPPCVEVCPSTATRKRADGLVTIDYDICIGCAYCAVSCPYQARTIAHDQEWYYGRATKQEEAVRRPERLGVAQKCTFCKERVDDGLARGLKPGVDPQATPACSAACIASAIHFGDFADPASNVSTLIRDNPSFQLNVELGTDPQIKYLYTTPAVPGRDTEAADTEEERMSDPANPLVGPLQTFWDWRAAMNWIFGGIGAGFAFLAWIGALLGVVHADMVPGAQLVGGGIMALGLFFVFLKIGRKLRFWRAATRWQSSWMTRELYVAIVFYAALGASILFGGAAFSAITALAALAFLVCQAKILHMARGISAWRVPLIPTMIVASGLLEGLGLLALCLGLFVGLGTVTPVVAGAGLALVGFNALHWALYRKTAAERGIVPLSRRVLARLSPPLHVVGHAVPAVAFVVALAVPAAASWALILGGLAAMAGGAWWKFGVIERAGYQQGFLMPKVPQRGSGARAAPPRTQGTPIRGAETSRKAA
jgi:phenylacetyl-CoA:acceptor oxidoreductase subunit 1